MVFGNDYLFTIKKLVKSYCYRFIAGYTALEVDFFANFFLSHDSIKIVDGD